jgi:hypothetical protein
VAQHYDNLGFSRTSVNENGVVKYRLSLSGYIAPQLPFHLNK